MQTSARLHRLLVLLTVTFALALAGAGSASAAGSPITEITQGPASASTVAAADAGFEFRADSPDATFECRTDGTGDWAPCSSPASPVFTTPGWHSFSVRATVSGVTGQPLTRQFQVEVPPAPKVLAADLIHSYKAAIPSSSAALARQGVKVDGQCNSACRMSVRLVLSRRAAKNAGLPTTLSVRSFDLAAGTASSFKVHLTQSLAGALTAAGRSVHGLQAKVYFSPVS